MALLGALERVEAPQGAPRFVLKGGVAIELRLRSGARATRDVDMVFRGPEGELIAALDAQKLHAITERPAGRENRRFRDLVDLLLLRDLIEDLGSLRAACAATFAERAMHPWPPRVDVPDDSWRAGYAQLAAAVGLDVVDVAVAANEVAVLIAAIDGART